jgi:DNA-binding MurR/RpiR family transcriptional regulator
MSKQQIINEATIVANKIRTIRKSPAANENQVLVDNLIKSTVARLQSCKRYLDIEYLDEAISSLEDAQHYCKCVIAYHKGARAI